ncbi:MAG: KamA family radical SAM protein [Deltaproteobacteria bacterium]|nr:KamA family radical SAM protein [Deltaproteobacteria bacterium]
MELWQQHLKESLTSPAMVARRFGIDPAPLERVAAIYPFRITPFYFRLLQGPDDPLWKQVVPDPAELAEDGLPADPLNEECLSPAPGIVHRYPDRVLFLVSGSCAGYCRFCTRKRWVGKAKVSFSDVLAGLDYIARTPSVRDVLLSGGDPLMMADLVLKEILERLRRIPHVEVIRVGTRLPVTLPERITEPLCRMLASFHPLFVNTHFNHPRELTPEAAEACRLLADAGIPVGNQTVLLRGVNDSAAILRELFQQLLRNRVRPYYLHQMDLTHGTGHFRTPLSCGLKIMAELRGTLSGLGIPAFVVDLPGGKGKIPLLPEYGALRGNEVVLRSPGGEEILYPDL